LHPRWLTENTLLYLDHATGAIMQATAPLWAVEVLGPVANELDAAAGVHAWSLRPAGQPPVVRTSLGGPDLVGDFEPCLSATGDLCVRSQATGTLRIEDLGNDTAGPILGAGTRARWSSQTLVWEWLGHVYGRSTPDQPTVELTITDRDCFYPVPCWDGREIWVLMVCDETGEIVVAEWGSLVSGDPMGYVLGRSSGQGYDHDVQPASWLERVLRVAWLTSDGSVADLLVDTSAPRQPLNPFLLAPDGTVVENCFIDLFGHHPSVKPGSTPDDLTICLHKNIGEQEWRQVLGQQDVLNIFDRSRAGGDTGWWIDPLEACFWAAVSFRSGQRFPAEADAYFEGERVEHPSGARVPWRHTITLYALKHGGVAVRFDPRFPTDYGPKKKYEVHFNATGGASRFEEWFTPAPGEPDRLLRRLNGFSDPHAPAQPYIPCPRPEEPEPPDPPDPPEPPMSVNAIPQDVTARSLQELRTFCWLYEWPTMSGTFPYRHDVEHEGALSDGLIYFLMEIWMPVLATPPNPGSLEGWEARRAQGDAALQDYMRRRVGDVPDTGPHPSPLLPPITTEGEAGFIEGAPV
jgi:hypothetical protein